MLWEKQGVRARVDSCWWWGHTGYAYALAQALRKKVFLSFLAPEGDALSERRLSKFGKVEFLIKPRGPKTPARQFIPRLAKAFMDSVGQPFHEFDVVVSSGSNFCVPPAIMAWMRGVPVVSMESPVRFSKPSKTGPHITAFFGNNRFALGGAKETAEGCGGRSNTSQARDQPREQRIYLGYRGYLWAQDFV